MAIAVPQTDVTAWQKRPQPRLKVSTPVFRYNARKEGMTGLMSAT
jgi:hypothetical protein